MSTDGVNVDRRRLLIGATAAMGAVGVAAAAVPFVKSWNPSAKAKAAGASVKANLKLASVRSSSGAVSRFGLCDARHKCWLTFRKMMRI